MNRRDALRKTGWLASATLATPTLLALLQSCQSSPRIDWSPEFLTEAEALFLASFVDTLLPRTDTPGALDVKVDVFIDKVWAQTTDEAGKANIREEISAFNQACIKTHQKPFAELSNADREAIMLAAEATSPTINGNIWGTTVGEQEPIGFYRSLKSMTLWAYTSTEQISTEVLTYDPIPGEYNGCLPLAEVGNRYSL